MPAPGVWLWFNQSGGRATADKRVRQALVQALDLGQVVRVSKGGTSSAATGLLAGKPKACNGDNVTGQLPTRDPAAAEAILDQAGRVKRLNGTRSKAGTDLTVGLHYATYLSSLDKSAAELMAQQWRAIGV